MAAQNRSQNLKIRPLDDRVVVEPVEAEEAALLTTKGGVLIQGGSAE